jgi:hypothetical protein
MHCSVKPTVSTDEMVFADFPQNMTRLHPLKDRHIVTRSPATFHGDVSIFLLRHWRGSIDLESLLARKNNLITSLITSDLTVCAPPRWSRESLFLVLPIRHTCWSCLEQLFCALCLFIRLGAADCVQPALHPVPSRELFPADLDANGVTEHQSAQGGE